MKKFLWLVLWMVCCVSNGWALAPDDFAFGVRIDVPPQTAIAALSLPEPVYTSTRHPQLEDIRVFNADGEPVPHMLRYARTQASQPSWQSLAFFPLPPDPARETYGYRVVVKTGEGGAVVRVDPGSSTTGGRLPRTFLIDVSRARGGMEALRLHWQPLPETLLTHVAVDASDDLVRWRTVQSRAALSDVRYAGRRLLGNIVDLKPVDGRYLRLRQLDAGPAITPIRIDGHRQPEGRHVVRALIRLEGKPVKDSPGVFGYDTAGMFPVDRINFLFDQANSLADAVVHSRSQPDADWHRRTSGLFYRIDVGDPPLTSALQAVPRTTDRYWRLTVKASESTMGNAVPQLEIGYRPHDLYFLARGSGPFTLAFGSTTVAPPEANLDALFAGIGKQHEAGLERWVTPRPTHFVLGGADRLSPSPRPLPTRRIVLWSILVGGVLVVALMAWRLARTMVAQ